MRRFELFCRSNLFKAGRWSGKSEMTKTTTIKKRNIVAKCKVVALLFAVMTSTSLGAEPLSLEKLLTPSTVIEKNGHVVTFAIHGFIEFKSLAELFRYLESERQRWTGNISEQEQQQLSNELLREGVESRVISMEDERPLETLVTHTDEELRMAIKQVREAIPAGYGDAFISVQKKWKHAMNCWSASPAIAGRVLSNWYPIEEGIVLDGATYDSAEHFWQGVKYHPALTVGELKELLGSLEGRDWDPWLKRLDDDPKLYIPNAYAFEFLRHNLTAERLHWFAEQLGEHGLEASDHVRLVQQRGAVAFRFSAYEEKVLWGDLADVFHLVYMFSLPNDPIRVRLANKHFDGIYLGERKMAFISEEFRSQMLEIWKVKYLRMPRFREVISSIPMELRLEHFLNDGDSPDIPIPIYVGYLNQIRDLARSNAPD
jgi:hypothetical protein